jgi:hypothetical protein
MQPGLDMMTSPELVAMIPVDEKDARMKRWQMPTPDLIAALIRRTRGRVIRADTGVHACTWCSPISNTPLPGAEDGDNYFRDDC